MDLHSFQILGSATKYRKRVSLSDIKSCVFDFNIALRGFVIELPDH